MGVGVDSLPRQNARDLFLGILYLYPPNFKGTAASFGPEIFLVFNQGKTLLPVQCTKMYNLPLRPLSPKDHLEEFYTHPRDVASELSHYSQALTGKNIYCNCDDPYISNIFKYLLEHFSAFSLRSLAATCYYRSTKYPARYIRINKSHPQPATTTTLEDVLKKGSNTSMVLPPNSGDFRSAFCLNILHTSDIVITNPPFSLAKEHLELLLQHGKDFLVVCDDKFLTTPIVQKYLAAGAFHTGITRPSRYIVPTDTHERKRMYNTNTNAVVVTFEDTSWLTSLQPNH